MAEGVTIINKLFESYTGPLLLLGVILVAIFILKYFQSISKKFSEIK